MLSRRTSKGGFAKHICHQGGFAKQTCHQGGFAKHICHQSLENRVFAANLLSNLLLVANLLSNLLLVAGLLSNLLLVAGLLSKSLLLVAGQPSNRPSLVERLLGSVGPVCTRNTCGGPSATPSVPFREAALPFADCMESLGNAFAR